MAQLAPCAFSHWQLSEEETLMGSILNQHQKHTIQNQLSQTAEQILNLTYDPLNPVDFAQQDAHLKGQMSAFRFLLTLSEESEIALKQRAQERAYETK